MLALGLAAWPGAAAGPGFATPGAGHPLAAAARTIVVDTDVRIERVADDLDFPFDQPWPDEAVFFRIRATSDGPDTARTGEVWIGADVISTNKPTIRGRRGLRCSVGLGGGVWIVLCRNTLVFRQDETVLSVLIRVKAAEGEKITVRARALKAPDVESDLVVKAKRDTAGITVARIHLAGEWVGQEGGRYTIRHQAGSDEVSWTGCDRNGGNWWTHDFEGWIFGEYLVGEFTDRAPGTLRNSGTLVLRIDGSGSLSLLDKVTIGGTTYTSFPTFSTRSWARGKHGGCP